MLTGEVWGPGVSSSRRSCSISRTVSRIKARMSVGSGVESSVEVLVRLGEAEADGSLSAIWLTVGDGMAGQRDEKKKIQLGGAVAGSCPEL